MQRSGKKLLVFWLIIGVFIISSIVINGRDISRISFDDKNNLISENIVFSNNLVRNDFIYGNEIDNIDLNSSRGQYYSLSEINSIIQDIADDYPEITGLKSIGTTYEGRDIWCLEISDNPGVDEGEPGVLFTGLHHGREWPSLNICLHIANNLTSNYESDPKVNYIVNNRRIWIVPCVNPDGYYFSHDDPNGINDWRKNRHYFSEFGSYGVDINRNYGGSYNGKSLGSWGSIVEGSLLFGTYNSHDPINYCYFGPSPFSENESQAIANLFIEYDICCSISWHTKGQYVLWPWCYSASDFTPENEYMVKLGEEIAARIKKQYLNIPYDAEQCGSWPSNLQWYKSSGNLDDWAYGYGHYVKGKAIFPYTIEACNEFQPIANYLDRICEENYKGAFYLLEEAEKINNLNNRVLPVIINNASIINNKDFTIYWEEKNHDPSSGVANFWLETPSDIESDKKIWLYYGNKNVYSKSNGSRTFLYFNNFSTNPNLDAVDHDADGHKSNFYFGSFNSTNQYIIESDYKITICNPEEFSTTTQFLGVGNNRTQVVNHWSVTSDSDFYNYPPGIKTTNSNYHKIFNYTTYPIRFIRESNNSQKLYIDDNLVCSGSVNNSNNINELEISIYDGGGADGTVSWDAGNQRLKIENTRDGEKQLISWLDNVAICKYTSPEPVIEEIGGEEIQFEDHQQWWNSNWTYRRLIKISNASNDNQMNLTIRYNSSENISCNGHCQLDFDDIRFIDYDNNTVLDYWIKDYSEPTIFQLDELIEPKTATDDAEKGKRDLKWNFESADHVTISSPEVNNRKAYFGSGNILYCINAENGSFIWNYEISNNVYTPTVDKVNVYFGSENYRIYCLDTTNGSLTWNYRTDGAIRTKPAIYKGKVYFGSWDRYLYCLNASNGSLIWRYKTDSIIESFPAIVKNKVYFGSWDSHVYCLNASNGSLIWKYKTNGGIHSSPNIYNERVYIGSYDNKIYCLNANNGSYIWSYKTKDEIRASSPTVYNNRVYIGSYDDRIYCLNAKNGNLIWQYKTGSNIYSSPTVANDQVFICSNDGKVYCLNAVAGNVIWEYSAAGIIYSSPILANGCVYFTSYRSLYCLYALSRFWSFDGFEVDDSKSHSGNFSFKSRDENEDVSALTTLIPIQITKDTNFSFWCWHQIDDYDYCFLEVSENGRNYEIIDKFNGQSNGWIFKKYNESNLSNFLNKSIFIRFRYTTNSTILGEGFFIDDISPVANISNILKISDSITSTKHILHNKSHGCYYYRVRGFNKDYGWGDFSTLKGIIYVNNLPNPPYNPNPTDGETDVDVEADLSWDCSDPDGDDITFNVYFEADDPTPDVLVSENQTETTYDPGTMEYETTYYWQIVAWDEYGASTNGAIWDFTTMSGSVTVLPDEYEIVRGSHISGGLSNLFYSDNSYLIVQYGYTLSSNEPPVWVRITGESSTTDPSVLRFTLESSVTVIGKIGQSIELYNYEDEEYEQVDSRQASTTDQIVQINITNNPSRFIDPSTNGMKAQLKYIQTGPVVAYPWSTKFDQTIWTIDY